MRALSMDSIQPPNIRSIHPAGVQGNRAIVDGLPPLKLHIANKEFGHLS